MGIINQRKGVLKSGRRELSKNGRHLYQNGKLRLRLAECFNSSINLVLVKRVKKHLTKLFAEKS